jgi:diguanylate cyclase (GGDEF)-like protein
MLIGRVRHGSAPAHPAADSGSAVKDGPIGADKDEVQEAATDTRVQVRRGQDRPPVPAVDADPLTGLLHREAMERELREHWETSQRTSQPCLLVVADIVGLERINAELGREGGDDVLRLVARILARNCRAYDVVGRIGEDEFAILLVGAKGERPSPYMSRVEKRLSAQHGAPSVSFGWSRLTAASSPEDAIDVANALRHERRASATSH